MLKFLTLEKETFGIDISDMSLKIVKLKKGSSGFALESFNQVDIEPGIIEKGVIQDEEALVKIIQSAYKSVKGKKLHTKYVIASLPEEKSFLQIIQMPKMDEKDLRSAILSEAENYIPLPISEVYLDFQVINPVKDHLDHLDVLIVAMAKKIINSYVACLKKAGLIAVVLEVESEAIARVLIKDEVSASPIILIDLGKNNTDFIVFAGRSVQFTYSIPISSFQLTTAVSKSLGVDLETAEKLKLTCDVSDTNPDETEKKVLQAINPILENLAAEIRKYLNFYQDHATHEHLATDEKIGKIFLCGGGANLKGLPEFLSNAVGIPVELKDFWMNFSSKKMKADKHENFLPFATALGLALRGIKKSSVK